jgi:hypothetical protein
MTYLNTSRVQPHSKVTETGSCSIPTNSITFPRVTCIALLLSYIHTGRQLFSSLLLFFFFVQFFSSSYCSCFSPVISIPNLAMSLILPLSSQWTEFTGSMYSASHNVCYDIEMQTKDITPRCSGYRSWYMSWRCRFLSWQGLAFLGSLPRVQCQ